LQTVMEKLKVKVLLQGRNMHIAYLMNTASQVHI